MNVKQHIRMTASEIAMGRYMRAPDHPAAVADPPAEDKSEDEFSSAFDAAILEDQATGGGGNESPAGSNAKSDGAAPADGAGDSGAGGAPADGSGAAAEAAGATGEGGTPAPAADDKGAAPEKGAKKGDKTPAADAGADGSSAAGGDAGDGVAPADGGAAGKDGKAAAAVPGEDTDAILDRLAEAVANKTPAKGKTEEPAAEAAPEAPPLFTEQEQATLAKFKEDWPSEHQAIELMQRELGRGVIEYVFNQIAPEVKQIKELAQTLALRAHVSDLTESIGDYDDAEVDAIKEWTKTQPAYLQQAYLNVIEGGTAEEVSDLVGRYREATGTVKSPAGAQDPEPKPAGGETELSGAAKQAAEALAPVGSKRSDVQNPDDAMDYDAGWAKWADMEV